MQTPYDWTRAPTEPPVPPHRHPWQPFPDPVMNISGRPVWQWADVKRWARETGRLD